jgi:hypothetical protein
MDWYYYVNKSISDYILKTLWEMQTFEETNNIYLFILFFFFFFYTPDFIPLLVHPLTVPTSHNSSPHPVSTRVSPSPTPTSTDGSAIKG